MNIQYRMFNIGYSIFILTRAVPFPCGPSKGEKLQIRPLDIQDSLLDIGYSSKSPGTQRDLVI